MKEQNKVLLSQDEVFAIFLREISQKVNDTFYKTMVKFILLYRDCLNEYGWTKRAEMECREIR